MPLIELALPVPLFHTFTYSHPEYLAPGTRVLVSFGSRKLVGVVWKDGAEDPEKRITIKPILELIEQSPIYSPQALRLAAFLSHYYLQPIGEVVKAMLPGGKVRGLDPPIAKIRKRPKKKPAQKVELPPEETSTSRSPQTSESESESESKAPLRTLSPEQLSILEHMESSPVFCKGTKNSESPAPKPFLLHGVTGSGKTEVYLRLVKKLLQETEEGQTLVLVPEISLTPQMLQIFEERFPGLVACVHSAMSEKRRWDELMRIRAGTARILIGPRSSVFAPFKTLSLIIVDEEHDSSYKQEGTFPYHARDVAVIRGKFEKAQVVLGSATPSLESYWNSTQGKYTLLEMKQRVEQRPLPKLFLIKKTKPERKPPPIAQEIVQALQDNLKQKNQAMVIVNRRGFANYLYDSQENKAIQCPHCSISLTLHSRGEKLLCHYCDYKASISNWVSPSSIAHKNSQRFFSIGYGSEKVENYLQEVLGGARIKRLDSDTTQKKGTLLDTLQEFKAGDIDILVGTQMIAKGHDFPRVTLIALCDVDKMLDLPDIRAGERTFQLIVQAAGRSGRGQLEGTVLVQSQNQETGAPGARQIHPTIEAGLRQDFAAYLERELSFRRAFAYPPFSHLILLEFSCPNKSVLLNFCKEAERWFKEQLSQKPGLLQHLKISGPSTPSIELVNKRFRRTVLLSSAQLAFSHSLAENFLMAFKKKPSGLRIHVDVDPQNLM